MATGTFWQRSWFSDQFWQRGWQLIGSLTPGQTAARIRFGWGFTGITRVEESFLRLSLQNFIMGVATTIGNQTEEPPSPRVHPEDIDPPSQRWLYWAGCGIQMVTIEPTATYAYWKSTDPQEPQGTKGMVTTRGVFIPDGQFLNIWATWEAFEDWPSSGWANVWWWSSVLVQHPT